MDAEPAGLLLAAGGSRRLGRPKQLLPAGGRTLVRRQAMALLEVVPQVVAVVGADASAVAAELEHPLVRVVTNAAWREGMGRSLAAGVAHLPGEAAAVLVLLCDQHRIVPDDLRRLLDAWRSDPGRIVASRWTGATGPPVVLPRSRFAELARLRGDTGARALVRDEGGDVTFVDIENARFDVDRPDDWGEENK